MKINVIACITLGAIVSATVSLPAAVKAEQSTQTPGAKVAPVTSAEDAKPGAQNKCYIPGWGWVC